MGILSLFGEKQRVTFIQRATSVSPERTIFSVDCTLQETHARESPPTEFEVEDGRTISDHIIVKPFSLELQGIISDSPIDTTLLGLLTTGITSSLPAAGIIAGAAGSALISALRKSPKPSVAAYGQLLQLQSSRQPFDVLTSLQRYPSMWIKSLSIPRDANTGKVLLFNLSLVQLIIVAPQTINIQKFASAGLSAGKTDAGSQAMKDLLTQEFQAARSAIKAIPGVP